VKSIYRVLAVSGLFAALVAVVGCGSSSSTSTSASTGAGTTASTTTSANASGQPNLKGEKLTIVNYGGVTNDSQKKAWLDPFTAATGASGATDGPSDVAKVKAQVESGNVTWDAVDLDGATGGAACGKLFKTRAEMGVKIDKVDPKYVSDKCGVPIMLQVVALMYNKKKYANNPPTKIQDFLDTAKFPGKRAIFNYPVGSLEPLLLAAGVPASKVYPYKYAVAEQAIKKLGSNLVLQNELAQQAEQLSSGNFDMCVCYNGRAAITPGVDPKNIGIVWDGAWAGYDMEYATKGSKVPKAQAAFLNYVATPKAQNDFVKIQPYEPMTVGPLPKVPAKFKYFMLSTNKDKLTNTSIVNYPLLGKPGVADEMVAKWTAMTSG